jgi:hypothetical protein
MKLFGSPKEISVVVKEVKHLKKLQGTVELRIFNLETR